MLSKKLLKNDVFKYFSDISNIPRISGKEEQISNYMVEFAVKHNLEVHRDKYNNILIRKLATPDKTNIPGIIMQGHLDMVGERSKNSVHDFLSDGIDIIETDDWLQGNQTTLGGDNGIGIAMALAVLANNEISHPELELVATVQEETGLIGATLFDTSNLKGKYFINLDSEDENEILIGSAGGLHIDLILNKSYRNTPKNYVFYKIHLENLHGGHSGMDINKNFANANILLGEFLYELFNEFDYYIASISGGTKDNAIPSDAEVVIAIHDDNANALFQLIETKRACWINEYKSTEPNIMFSIDDNKPYSRVFQDYTVKAIVHLLAFIPNGIESMEIGPLSHIVRTSSNLGKITETDNKIIFSAALRSSSQSELSRLQNRFKVLATLLSGEYKENSAYPSWSPDTETNLLKQSIKIYEKTNNRKPVVTACHAGIECGIFKEKKEDLEIISIGPDIMHPHSINEKMCISSVIRTYDFLLNLITEIQ
jgi:dipeptidase D